MKLKLTHLLIFIIFLSSCEKAEFKHDLVGKWKIFGSGGGITGQGDSFDFDFMFINSVDDYRFTRNDTTIESGIYSIITNESMQFRGDFSVQFSAKTLPDANSHQIFYRKMIVERLSRDTLTICDGMIDGFEYYFKRQ